MTHPTNIVLTSAGANFARAACKYIMLKRAEVQRALCSSEIAELNCADAKLSELGSTELLDLMLAHSVVFARKLSEGRT